MRDEHRVTILGCGSSGGVPRLGGPDGAGMWGACDPENPKNARRRCSILVERRGPGGVTRALIDTGPDMRQQLIDARVAVVDAVLYTHDHADHTNGVDDLRQIFLQTRRRVDVWADKTTGETLMRRFDYVFVQPEGSDYPPILDLREISEAMIAGETPLVVDGAGGPLTFRPFRALHGRAPALGFRVGGPRGGVAYLPDANVIPEDVWPALEGLDLWIVDALRHTPHPAHATVAEALVWIERARPGRAVLTNMHLDLDYEALRAELPAGVTPAYDGMALAFDPGLDRARAP